MKAENYADVITLLARHRISTEKWGNHTGTKTLGDLANEVVSGESVLMEEEGVLFRKTYVSSIVLFHLDSQGSLWVLKEDRQVFRDGGVTRRRKLPVSIAEKCQPGELSQAAILRGVKEELHLDRLQHLESVLDDVETKLTPSWPGLMAMYHFFRFQGFIRPEDFNPEGYVHEQPDKISYFVWSKVCTIEP